MLGILGFFTGVIDIWVGDLKEARESEGFGCLAIWRIKLETWDAGFLTSEVLCLTFLLILGRSSMLLVAVAEIRVLLLSASASEITFFSFPNILSDRECVSIRLFLPETLYGSLFILIVFSIFGLAEDDSRPNYSVRK